MADMDAPEPSPSTELGPSIVGVGASAGGLEALRDLVSDLPADLDAAFVILQHMSPQYKSMLPDLISRVTTLPTLELADGTEPRPNTIYVVPPNHDVVFADGKLTLCTPHPGPANPKPSVDRFFLSLAEGAAARSVGVVLSGTGSDGAVGIRAIRAAGGVTIAQDTNSAKYDGMPAAAAGTGDVDLVLPPSEIAQHLRRILTAPRDIDAFRSAIEHESGFADILQIVEARKRVDFSDYKTPTVLRRIQRRMDATGIGTMTEYVALLRRQPDEIDTLFRDLLISVTRFFRDRSEFETLAAQIKTAIAERDSAGPVRIWVAGCATGEEAYSVGILAAEALGGPAELNRGVLQIFATDLDSSALAIGRNARYGAMISADVPPDLVSRYFYRDGEFLVPIPALQSCMLFSEHNMLQDPPFLSLDLICCRNVLIYFTEKVQRRVLSRFEFSLRPGGLLFLGTAETVPGADLALRPVQGSAHLFRRTNAAGRATTKIGQLLATPRRTALRSSAATEEALRASHAMFNAMVASIGPNAVLVTADMRIRQVFGDVSRFIALRQSTRPEMSLSMLVDGIQVEARALVTLAQRSGSARYGLSHTFPGREGEHYRLAAFALDHEALEPGLVLLVFDDDPYERPTLPRLGTEERSMSALQREVLTTREALQDAIEELEISNEQLQSLNAELQATNEELQSANEELETTNEELQSTNEELITVNEEQQISAAELALISEELRAVLVTIATPIIVVDSALQVTLASAAAEDMFGTFSRRPHISHLRMPGVQTDITELLNEVLRTRMPCTTAIRVGPTMHTVKIAPFVDTRDRLLGASIVFTEAGAAAGAGSARTHFDAIYETVPGPVIERDATGRVCYVNSAGSQLLGIERTDILGHALAEFAREETPDDKDAGASTAPPQAITLRIVAGPSKGRSMAANKSMLIDPEDGNRSILIVAHGDVDELRDASGLQ
ncbi:MAG: chemotaxis protein CheB [Pseudomonadota bacterium]